MSTVATTQEPQTFQFSNLTIKGKKNSKVKVIANERDHNPWWTTYRRKRIMSEYFSETAFGSESDSKKELWHPHQEPLLVRKYRVKLLVWNGGQYDENNLDNTNKIALMNKMEFDTQQ